MVSRAGVSGRRPLTLRRQHYCGQDQTVAYQKAPRKSAKLQLRARYWRNAQPGRESPGVGIKAHADLIETQLAPREGKPCFVNTLLRTEEHAVPMYRFGRTGEPGTLLRIRHALQYVLGQLIVHFRIDADRQCVRNFGGDGSAIARTMRDAAYDASWPERLAMLTAQDRDRKSTR